MGKISVVINTLNEEKNLARAIGSIRQLADEIVVVDMESDDRTVEVAKKLGAKVFNHKRISYVEPARNFGISKVADGERSRTSWILILDPDEEISPGLSKNLRKIVKSANRRTEADYYRIPRKNIIFGKWIKHSRWWPDYKIRFFKKGFVSWNETIHSVPMTQGKGADLPAKEEFALIHHNYFSVEQYLERMNRYTHVQAEELLKNGYVFSWQDLLIKPMGEFLSRYFAGEGYKDGIHGLALALLQGFSETVLYLKIWQKQGFREKEIGRKEIRNEFKKIVKDLKWWMRRKLTWLKFL
jgi:(heptosyl)LPS beta-1,4-glucosyltransferase